MNCECEAAGFCKRFNKTQGVRHREICRGEAMMDDGSPMSEQMRAVYIKNWERMASGRVAAPPPPRDGRPSLPPAPSSGPGTELEEIFKAAGAKSDLCAGLCAKWRNKMDRWGVDGCREHRGEIIRHIRKAMFKTWVADQMAAGWVSLAIAREPWFKIAEPVGCIVDEAIRRAEDAAKP